MNGDNGEALTSSATASYSGAQFDNTAYSNANAPISAGNYTLAVAFAGTNNYNPLSSSATQSFVIQKASMTVTANNATKTLGQTVTFQGTEFTTAGLVQGDTVTSVTLTSTGAVGTANVGSYPVIPSAAQGIGLNNYNLTYLNGSLNVVYSVNACLGDLGHSILQPINANGLSTFKQGSTVPAKFRVCDANGNSVATAGVVKTFTLAAVLKGTMPLNTTDDIVSTTPDAAFRWDPTGQQWIFNISTKNLQPGNTYVYQIQLNDGSTIPFQYGLPK
jgi:hypothetical protein